MKKLFLLILLFFICAPAAAGAATIGRPVNTLGLAGYWPLDGATTNWATGQTSDLSGQGNTGALISLSTTTSPVIGKVGQALQFNGSSQYINVGGNSGVLNITGDITLSVWVKTTTTGTFMILNKTSGAGTNGYEIYLNDGGTTPGQPTFRINSVSSTNGVTSSVTVNDGRWHIVTGTLSGLNAKIYIDGVLQGSNTITTATLSNSSASFEIGARAGSLFFPGSIDEARVYNRALSAAEVAALYRAGAATVGHANTSTLSSGLVGYWPLDGAATNWATGQTSDLSGQGNTGALVSMSTTTSPVIGKVGQALQFPKANSEVATPIFPSSYTNISVSLWAKPVDGVSTGDGSGRFMFAASDGGANRFYLRQDNATGPATNLKLGLSSWNPVESNATSLNHWHHYVVVLNGVNGYFYVDGKLFDSTTGLTVSLPAIAIAIGNGGQIAEQPTDYFKGPIDDVRVYNRALSAGEVQALYELGQNTVAHSNAGTNAPLSSGLVGYWPLDGAATNWATGQTSDLSGQGNTGALISLSTTTSPVIGKVGQALNFNGTTQYIDMGDVLDFGYQQPWTVAAWVKLNSTAGVSSIVSKEARANPFGGWALDLNAGKVRCSYINNYSTNYFQTQSNAVISANVWVHVAAVYTTNACALYVNGVAVAQTVTQANANGDINTANHLNVGGRDDNAAPSDSLMRGALDDVRVYNRALSSGEVAALYAAGR